MSEERFGEGRKLVTVEISEVGVRGNATSTGAVILGNTREMLGVGARRERVAT